MRIASLLLATLAMPAWAFPLNDTGLETCWNGTTLDQCRAEFAGDAGLNPRQDGRFGRDAQATAGTLTKVGGGMAGFDFTKLDSAGNPLSEQAAEWSCVKDNRTGLIWEGKTDLNMNDLYTFSQAQDYAAAANLCGFNAGWRVPSRRELLSIVNYGQANPAIDGNYFPTTKDDNSPATPHYWTSDNHPASASTAWSVDLLQWGYATDQQKDAMLRTRLVRTAQ